MHGMTGGVEVFWTLLICNYIKFNHIPRDVELVIFHWLSCCFFLDADIGHGDPNSQFRPIVKAYVLGPFTYQQQLAVRANLTHRLFGVVACIAWYSWPGRHVWYVWFSQMLVGFYMRSFVVVMICLTRAMLFVFPFGKHDSGTQAKYLAVWVY